MTGAKDWVAPSLEAFYRLADAAPATARNLDVLRWLLAAATPEAAR